jgi:hypothetical protein
MVKNSSPPSVVAGLRGDFDCLLFLSSGNFLAPAALAFPVRGGRFSLDLVSSLMVGRLLPTSLRLDAGISIVGKDRVRPV